VITVDADGQLLYREPGRGIWDQAREWLGPRDASSHGWRRILALTFHGASAFA